MVACPVAAVLADAAVTLGEPGLARIAAGLRSPLRVTVTGRPGAGRRTVAEALRAAGVTVVDGTETPDVVVYVFVETLTPEDRAALENAPRPCVAVLNKADLTGFAEPGPMAAASARCRALQHRTGVPTVALAAPLAAAGAVLDGEVFDAVCVLAAGGLPAPAPRQCLASGLGLFGTAEAVLAVRSGADRAAVLAALRGASGIDAVLTEIDRAAAPVRYRRMAAAMRALTAAAAGRRGAEVARVLSGDALVLARMAVAAEVVRAAGMPVDLDGGRDDHLRRAIGWQNYAGGPVSALHRRCGIDLSRGCLRRWARAGGRPEPLRL